MTLETSDRNRVTTPMSHTLETRQRAYAKVKARRQRWLEENGPCTRCRSIIELHVDHIDPSTKTSHNVWSWEEKRRAKELTKCQVLCRKCHEEKTSCEKSNPEYDGKIWCSGHRTYMEKPLFFRTGKRRRGYLAHCKECRNRIKREYRRRKRERGLLYT